MRDGMDRIFALRVLAIAAGALALRVFYTVVIDPHQAGIGDFYYYQDLATALAKGYGFVDPGSAYAGHAVPTALHPPLWPWLLSLVSRTGLAGSGFGEHGPGGYVAHRLTCGVLGVGTVVAIAYLGRRVAGARAGLLAAGIAAVYPVLIGADASLLAESLFGLCVAVSMLLAYRLLDHPSGWSALALGAAIGVASLARSEGLVLLALLALPVAWRGGTPARLVALRVLIACLGAAVVIAPWTARNWHRFDRPVIGSNNSGSVIAGANCARVYHGSDVGLWDVACIGRGTSPNEAAESARERRQGFDYARDHAGRLPLVAAVRVLRTWDLFQPWSTVALNEGRDPTVSRIGLVFYWLLAPFAIAGAVMLARRGAPLRILLAPVLLVTIISATGWGITRFRHAAEISIVIFAAVALSALYDRLRRDAPGSTPIRSSRGACS